MKRLSLLLVMIFMLGLVASVLSATEVTIGAGDQTARVPVDMYWKNSLFECLYYPDELGFVSGTISGVKFYNNFVSNLTSKPTKIWLGTTTQTALSAYIPSTQLTLVFDGVVDYPSGANTINITFTTPFAYTGSNLVMMVNRPMDTEYFSSSDYFQCQAIGTNRALNNQSDTTLYDPAAPPTTPTISGMFPKTTIVYTGQMITNDLGCLTISGNTTPSAQSAWNYNITVKNNGSVVQNTYTVKLMKEGDVLIDSAPGTAIQPQETLTFTIPWTPTTIGPTYLYGKVELTGDEIATNNQTANYPVVVQEAGIVAVTVGAGGSTGRMPVDMFYKNSLFESIYLATELNIGGLLTGIQFYNNFVTATLQNMPTNIWVGETTLTNLSGGWIPSTQLTQVFTGNVNYPAGANNINIPLTTPFPYGGGNLVVMVERPMDTVYYSSSDVFVTQTVGTNRTLNLYSDSTDYDPAAPPAATATGIFPKTTFFFITQGMGTLTGTVNVGTTPLAGATVTVANSTLTYTTGANGVYSFPYIAEGVQQVTATKHGYTAVTLPATIVEDQTTTLNFAIALLPQVTVTGKVVGSDAPTVGIAGATIALSGYEPYSATTNATGNFTITGVFASQTYNYIANATGYQPATGTVVVGTSNVNMGNITVNEMAFPPFGVVATEAANFSNVTLTWQAPNPGATGITEGFEGTTFPPTDWTQVITDTSAAGTTGVLPTWCHLGTVALTPAVPPHTGEKQTGLFWSYNHQDEWLKTPQFTCPPAAVLTFWSYVFLGSTNNDHYYVKVSTDNGGTWTPVWDATAQTGGWNYYATPITVNLTTYAGQPIKIAWHADDPNTTSDGMWYAWLMDDVSIASPTGLLKFNNEDFFSASQAETKLPVSYPTLPASRAMVANPKLSEPALSVANNDRTMLGYRVWRLLAANQANETLWTPLTTTNIVPATYVDNAWQPLPSGVYKYAVKAAYTNGVFSTPAFSNEIHKGMMGTLTGSVTEFGTNLPVAGATITAGDYSGVSNATGVYSFAVYAGTYTVTCAKASYQTATQAGVVIAGTQTTTQNFVMTEITLPAAAVVAVEAGANVNVTWMAPGTAGGEWLSYDGLNDDSIGTGGVADFDVAIRFPATALADYQGMSLYALKLWPAQAGTFSARVWTGGTATAPATMVADQAFTPTLDVYNTVTLTNPVAVPNGELWFGYRCNVTTGYPAGCDAGPQVEGFGNMMYWQSAWTTLTVVAPTLTYNWNIQGYVGYSAPTSAPLITYAHVKPTPTTTENRISYGTLGVQGSSAGRHSRSVYSELLPKNTILHAQNAWQSNRTLTGYKVWRLIQGQETNEGSWITLTPDPITATACQDPGWNDLPDGTYRWSVKAIYTGGAASLSAFSNPLSKITQIGTIAGIVRNMQNQPIQGATVTCGDVTATTNNSGAYSMQLLSGTHSVTASHASYNSVTHTGIVVITGQTTTVNFQLPTSTNLLGDDFEVYPNFAITFAPWTLVDVDQSTTYGMTGIAWDNAYAAQAYIIFNQSATVPPVTDLYAHSGSKIAACFASTTPPNNDWLISPQVTDATSFKFWAKSYTAEFGLERFKVGVSTTGTNPNDFTIISGANYVEAPIEWTEYTYNLTQTGPVYIGIQCISNDAFIFCVDDVLIGGSDGDDPVVSMVTTELHNNFPNPFNPETTITYSVKGASPVSIEIYNVKGQLVKTLVNDSKEAGTHSVVWNGMDGNGRAVSSGVYYYKMNAGKYSSTRKMILMK